MKPSTAKAKGTATETALVRYLHQEWGLVGIERRRLAGANDRGDLAGWPGVCVEIKSGASLDLPGWLRELDVEADNADAETGFVAVRPKGLPDPAEWYAVMRLPWLLKLMDDAGWMPEDRSQLAAVVPINQRNGGAK